MADRELIERAAEAICTGRLAAFPTETVYGLGANALDAAAVARIYKAKGRPPTSPIIVHVDSLGMARSLASDWPDAAEKLARCFWPGPLTLVVRKNARVPDIVTAGLDTVALRMPAHPIALALIRAARVPIAAPSANRFSELSPTRAQHVAADLADVIIDGGATDIGIESTVLSVACDPPVLLRPGMVTREDIERLIGPVELAAVTPTREAAHPSPGMHARHYSPRTPLLLVRDGAVPREGRGAYVGFAPGATVRMPGNAAAYATALYHTLHELDAAAYDWIAVEEPPATPEWAAIRDRLERAATRD